MDREVPLCSRCLEPVRPRDYYCERCGQAVGQYTTYLPYIDIPFQVDFLATLWRRLWSRDTGPLARIGFFLMVLFLTPILFLALPFILWDKRRR